MAPICVNFSSVLSNWADLAQVVIAIANIILASYIFLFERSKHQKSERQIEVHHEQNIRLQSKLHENNIKLQWFSQLILQPNIGIIYDFYSKLINLKTHINSDTLDEEKILELTAYIKKQAADFRKEFIELIHDVDGSLYDQLQNNIDALVDELVEVICNDEHKLTNDKTFERHIETPINYSKAKLLATIYTFKAD